MAKALNILVILLEIPGFYRSISDRKWTILAYYTQLSNICALASSFIFVTLGEILLFFDTKTVTQKMCYCDL